MMAPITSAHLFVGAIAASQVDRASGLLGSSLGVMMSTDEIEKAFRKMDPDGESKQQAP